jgi:hypothetical protein
MTTTAHHGAYARIPSCENGAVPHICGRAISPIVFCNRTRLCAPICVRRWKRVKRTCKGVRYSITLCCRARTDIQAVLALCVSAARMRHGPWATAQFTNSGDMCFPLHVRNVALWDVAEHSYFMSYLLCWVLPYWHHHHCACTADCRGVRPYPTRGGLGVKVSYNRR